MVRSASWLTFTEEPTSAPGRKMSVLAHAAHSVSSQGIGVADRLDLRPTTPNALNDCYFWIDRSRSRYPVGFSFAY